MSKKIIISVVAIIIVIIAVIYFFSSSKSVPPSTQQTTPPAAASPSSQATASPTPSASVTATPLESSPKIHNISVINFSFDPQAITVNKGDTVIWTNKDSTPHQIAGGTFNGPVMNNGQNYSFVFNSIGTFNYHCAIHPSMTGTITVK